MSLTAEQVKKMDRMEAYLNSLVKANSGVQPAGVFSEFGPTQYMRPWPTKQLEALTKAYNHEGAVAMLSKGAGGRKPRAIGWGPDLVKMVGANIPESKFKGNDAELEKSGWFSVTKAANEGVRLPNGEVRKTAMAEGSGITGGYLVPPQYQAELLTIAAEDAFIEPAAKVVPMASRTMQWPMLDITTAQATGTSPYFGGVLAQWQPEAATIDETEPQFKMTDWTAWDLVLYSVSSYQLLMDNGIGLDALLTQLFAQAITWYKEYAFINGRGAGNSMPLGILNAPATYTQTRTTSSQFKLADASAMLSRLQVRSWDSAMWIMHPSVIPQLIQMTNGATNAPFLVWINPTGSGDDGPAARKLPKAFLNGLPIHFTEKAPTLGTTGDVMLVDWSQYVIGNRLEYQIDVSKDYLFRTNQLAWRVIARCDGKPWLNSYITDAAGWVSSPFVALSSATS